MMRLFSIQLALTSNSFFLLMAVLYWLHLPWQSVPGVSAYSGKTRGQQRREQEWALLRLTGKVSAGNNVFFKGAKGRQAK